jgi:hypothetical protein
MAAGIPSSAECPPLSSSPSSDISSSLVAWRPSEVGDGVVGGGGVWSLRLPSYKPATRLRIRSVLENGGFLFLIMKKKNKKIEKKI